MQEESSNAPTIGTPDTAHRLVWEEALRNWAEAIEPAGTLPVDPDRDRKAHERAFPVVYHEPPEEDLNAEQKYMGWKLVTIWTGAIGGSWALLIGCVLIARAILA